MRRIRIWARTSEKKKTGFNHIGKERALMQRSTCKSHLCAPGLRIATPPNETHHHHKHIQNNHEQYGGLRHESGCSFKSECLRRSNSLPRPPTIKRMEGQGCHCKMQRARCRKCDFRGVVGLLGQTRNLVMSGRYMACVLRCSVRASISCAQDWQGIHDGGECGICCCDIFSGKAWSMQAGSDRRNKILVCSLKTYG